MTRLSIDGQNAASHRLGSQESKMTSRPICGGLMVLTVAGMLIGSDESGAQPVVRVFGDATFDDSEWTTESEGRFAGGSLDFAGQEPSGGNPGSFRRITMTVNGSSEQGSGIWSHHFKTGATYDPGISGPIATIDYSEDARCFSGPGLCHVTGPVLRQGGRIFPYRAVPLLVTPETSWTPKELTGLTAEDFCVLQVPGLCDQPGAEHPDFSSFGSEIELGFYRAITNNPTTNTRSAGIDNWQIVVNALEPADVPTLPRGSLGFLGALLALCGGLLAERRHRANRQGPAASA